MNVSELLIDLSLTTENVTIHKQPDYAKSILLKLEEHYHLNTSDIINNLINEYQPENIDNETLLEWTETFSDFTTFHGDVNELNRATDLDYLINNKEEIISANDANMISSLLLI